MSFLTLAQHSTQFSILLETIDSDFGVSWTALKWFTSYPSQRAQQIQIKGTLSEKNTADHWSTTWILSWPCAVHHLYCRPVSDHRKAPPEAQGYADDHQVYLSFRPIPSTNQTNSVTAIEKCMAELRSCMISNMLMVNDRKTEFLIVGSKQQLERVNIPFINVGEDQITPVMSEWNLGVCFF